jgi:hypothetical protein
MPYKSIFFEIGWFRYTYINRIFWVVPMSKKTAWGCNRGDKEERGEELEDDGTDIPSSNTQPIELYSSAEDWLKHAPAVDRSAVDVQHELDIMMKHALS